MKIQVNSNFGRFATQASTEISDELFDADAEVTELEQVKALIASGLENLLFRAGGSAGFKAVVALGGDALADDAGVVKPIDKKTPRANIPYSEARAKALVEAMDDAVNTEKSEFPYIEFKVTGEHEYGEKNGGGVVRATAFVETMWSMGEGSQKALRDTLAVFDPSAATATKEELVPIAHRAMFAKTTKA